MLKVQLITINPWMAKEIQIDAVRTQENDKKEKEGRRSTLGKMVDGAGRVKTKLGWGRAKNNLEGSVGENESMETRILENTLIKLGMLLMVGLGEAGLHIVSRSMN